MLRAYRRTRSEQSANSEQIPLSPVGNSHDSSFKPGEGTVDVVAAVIDDREKQRRRVYIILIGITLLFLLLNILQIAFIYEFNPIYWTAVIPGVILAICSLFLTYQVKKNWKGLSEVNEHPKWPRRTFRLGIVVTVLLNILACEFAYLNGVAVYAARTKVWRVSLNTEQSLPPPAIALYHLTAFEDRAILLDDNAWLNQAYHNQTADGGLLSNQRRFTNWSTFPAKGSTGIVSGNLSYVSFNATYRNMTTLDDLDIGFWYYYDENTTPASGPALDFVAFDPKFLASPSLFEKAINCGIVNGRLFIVTSRIQVLLEQTVIHDVVNDIEYTKDCDDEAFRHFTFYRPSLSAYTEGDVNDGCALDGQITPSDPWTSPPCGGDVDIKFSTMLVASQTSSYSKSRTEMFTDEGGIIGAITFLTWFMGILTE